MDYQDFEGQTKDEVEAAIESVELLAEEVYDPEEDTRTPAEQMKEMAFRPATPEINEWVCIKPHNDIPTDLWGACGRTANILPSPIDPNLVNVVVEVLRPDQNSTTFIPLAGVVRAIQHLFFDARVRAMEDQLVEPDSLASPDI